MKSYFSISSQLINLRSNCFRDPQTNNLLLSVCLCLRTRSRGLKGESNEPGNSLLSWLTRPLTGSVSTVPLCFLGSHQDALRNITDSCSAWHLMIEQRERRAWSWPCTQKWTRWMYGWARPLREPSAPQVGTEQTYVRAACGPEVFWTQVICSCLPFSFFTPQASGADPWLHNSHLGEPWKQPERFWFKWSGWDLGLDKVKKPPPRDSDTLQDARARSPRQVGPLICFQT